MDAELYAIGPYKAFRPEMLDYDLSFYEDVAPDDPIITLLACAVTDRESEELAQLCGVRPWNLGNHKLSAERFDPDVLNYLTTDAIGNEDICDLYGWITSLLANPDVSLWFRPNG